MKIYRSDKYEHYWPCYSRELAGLKITSILEIGVAAGGSLQRWRNLYPGAQVSGVDIDPRCLFMQLDGVRIYTGNSGDRAFLRTVAACVPRPQLIVDDGSHWPRHQRIAFEILWPHLDSSGVYAIEDLHTHFLAPWRFGNWCGNSFRFLQGLLKRDLYRYWSDSGRLGRIVKMTHYPAITFLRKGWQTEPRVEDKPGDDCRTEAFIPSKGSN